MGEGGEAWPLPIEIEAVDRDWLEAALRRDRPGVRLGRAEVIDVAHGTCTRIRLALDADGLPNRVIVKGGFEPHSRAMGFMHAHEVHSYADVAPLSPLRMPECFFAGFDAERQQGIVILDDLVARGVRFCHPQAPLTVAEVATRLSALARHHALSWGREADFAPGGRFAWAGGYIEGFAHFGALLTPPVWQSYVESPRGAAASTRFHSLEWMQAALARLLGLSRGQPPVLLHGDTHLGNLYVDGDGTPGFFDAQPHRGPAMCEVAYHVTCALDPADRRQHDRALVAHYRSELVRLGIAPPPPGEMMRQFGAFLAAGYCIFLVNASAFQPEAVNTAYTARFSAAMLDHDTIGLLEAAEGDTG
jgi:hypothetical protein